MSKFHEIIKELLEEFQTFLVTTLASESLTANALSRRESLLMKLSVIKEEYPQLHLSIPTQEVIKDTKTFTIQITPTKHASGAPASPPPYFDMAPKNPSPILAAKNIVSPVQNNSEEYEEYDGDAHETLNLSSRSEPKSISELDSLILDESVKAIPDVPANELKKADKFGYLEKKGKERLGGLLSPFQKRWCAIMNGIFYIFESENDKKQKNYIDLLGYEARTSPTACKDVNKKNLCFELVCPGKRSHQFIALTTKDLKQWISIVDKNSAVINSNESTPISAPPNLPTTNEPPILNKKEAKNIKELPPSPKEVTPEFDYGDDDIYEPVDELDTPVISEPLYEEGELLTSPDMVEEELYVDGGEHPPINDPMYEADFNPSDWYVALWDCDTTDPMELKFTRGDLIKITSKQYDANEWWTGILCTNNKTGLVPKIFLMEAYEAV